MRLSEAAKEIERFIRRYGDRELTSDLRNDAGLEAFVCVLLTEDGKAKIFPCLLPPPREVKSP